MHIAKVEHQINLFNREIRDHTKKNATSLDINEMFNIDEVQKRLESKLARLRRVLVTLKEQEMDKNMNQQYVMKPTDEIDTYYSKAVKQFGYVNLYATLLPYTSFLFWVCGWFSIRIKLISISQYSRRMRARQVTDIGIWKTLTAFITFASIPMNLAVIMLIGDDNPNRADDEKMTQSETVKFIISWSEYWNMEKARILLFSMEHILFFLLIVIMYKWVVIPEDIKTKLNARGQEMDLAKDKMDSLREEMPEFDSIRSRKMLIREYLDTEKSKTNDKGTLVEEEFE